MSSVETAIRGAITPLRMIFWGGLLCVLDFEFNRTTNGSGWSLDVLNDAVGVGLILAGVVKLRGIRLPGAPTLSFGFAAFAATLALLKAIHGHFIYPTPTFVNVSATLIGLCSLVGIIVFCVAMQQVCRITSLRRSQSRWFVTTLLFVVIYLLPLGWLNLALFTASVGLSEFELKLGFEWALMVIPLLLAPLISFFVATSGMVGEIRENELRERLPMFQGVGGTPRPPTSPALQQVAPGSARPRAREWVAGEQQPPVKHPGATDRYV